MSCGVRLEVSEKSSNVIQVVYDFLAISLPMMTSLQFQVLHAQKETAEQQESHLTFGAIPVEYRALNSKDYVLKIDRF